MYMGLLRFLLALTVALFHTNPAYVNNITSTDIAVHSFFIISGFYMAFIYRETYMHKVSSYKLFITNRLLRIYPLYWTILLLIVFVALTKLVLQWGSDENVLVRLFALPMYDRIWRIIQNVFFVITPDYWIQPFKNPDFVIGPQVWSLQVEVPFYLLVPFILRNHPRKILTTLTIILIVIYGLIFPLHILSEQSLLYLFLSNIVYFSAGIVSYLLYTKSKLSKTQQIFSFLFALSFMILIPTMQSISFLYYLCLTLCIPVIFELTKANTIDRFIGSLSYPLFISHIFFGSLVAHLLHIQQKTWQYPFIFVCSAFIGSVFLALYVEKPLNIYRRKRVLTARSSPHKQD